MLMMNLIFIFEIVSNKSNKWYLVVLVQDLVPKSGNICPPLILSLMTSCQALVTKKLLIIYAQLINAIVEIPFKDAMQLVKITTLFIR